MTLADRPPPKRIRKEDLSGLSERQLRLRKQVMDVGRVAFGSRWQTDFAAALSEEAGREVRFVQVSQWVSGYRPVPESLAEPIQRLTMRCIEDAERRAAEIREIFPRAPADDAGEGPREQPGSPRF